MGGLQPIIAAGQLGVTPDDETDLDQHDLAAAHQAWNTIYEGLGHVEDPIVRNILADVLTGAKNVLDNHTEIVWPEGF